MEFKHADSVFAKLELQGKWWVPESPDHKVDGILKGSQAEGFRLELMGSLNPEETIGTPLVGQKTSHAIIHGNTTAGEFSLLDLFLIGRNATFSRVFNCRFHITSLLKGTHLADSSHIRFHTLRSRFSVLCAWINAQVFEQDGHSFESYDIKFRFPKKQLLHEDGKFSVFLEFRCTQPGSRVGQNDLVVDWEPEFVIKAKDTELPWDDGDGGDLSSIVHSLNQFLCVATFGPSYPFDITGASEQFQATTVSGEITYCEPIELWRERDCPAARYDFLKALFSWKDFADDPKPYFGNWLKLERELRAPVNLLVDSFKRRGSYTADRFLNMMIALEGLHRFKYPQPTTEIADHKSKVEAILKSCPQEYHEWLCDKVQHSYQPTLRRRLKDLAKPFEGVFDWLIGGDGGGKKQKHWRNKVIGAILESRDSLAHGLKEAGKNPGLRYVHFTHLAELLMAMWLMKEIGIEVEDIRERIEKNYSTSQTRDRIVEFLKDELGSSGSN